MLVSSRFEICSMQTFSLARSVRALGYHKEVYQRSYSFLAEWCDDPECKVVDENGKRCPRVHEGDPFSKYSYIRWSSSNPWKRWVNLCNCCGWCHDAQDHPDACPNFANPLSYWEQDHKQKYAQNNWFWMDRCWDEDCSTKNGSTRKCRYVHDTDEFLEYLNAHPPTLHNDNGAKYCDGDGDVKVRPVFDKRWTVICEYCNTYHDGTSHSTKCPWYEKKVIRLLETYANEFPILVVTDGLSGEKLTLSSFHMPVIRDLPKQQLYTAQRCEWGLYINALHEAGRKQGARGFLIGGDTNILPEDYKASGMCEARDNLKFLKKDDGSGLLGTCFSGPECLRRADETYSFPLDNVITNMTWAKFDDETEYGKQPNCPSDHIPVRVRGTYVRRSHIPIRYWGFAKSNLTDEALLALTLPCNWEMVREVDLSYNEITSDGLRSLRIPWEKCVSLQKLKLFDNKLDDGCSDLLSDLVERIHTLREVHLTNNSFTETGLKAVIEAGHRRTETDAVPLWLRVEYNDLPDPRSFYAGMIDSGLVCPVKKSCSNTYCSVGCKVHLRFWLHGFFEDDAEEEEDAK
eukprot:TRINITY_DN13644_c1_g2_i3.p1 TRINITY_DN13644_c1_g2~~TRINITY_DN13644_c1_g2_i3.p1  ORF type:complete len:660 (+),score=81.54 TRINITY_DN13644_c1_g2_i3:264-1982(+)